MFASADPCGWLCIHVAYMCIHVVYTCVCVHVLMGNACLALLLVRPGDMELQQPNFCQASGSGLISPNTMHTPSSF